MGLEIPHIRVADDKQTQNLDRLKPWADGVDDTAEGLGTRLTTAEGDIVALPQGLLGIHELTSSFTTTGTHTSYQDEGLNASVAYGASRRLRVTLKVHLDPTGGAPQIIRLQVLRTSTTVGVWQHRAEAGGVTSKVFTTVFSTGSAATETFKVQMLAAAGNTAVQSYADSNFTRQLTVEDIGAV